MKSYTIQYDKSRLITPPRQSPYILDERLGKAVEVAITLNMPLLVTGEPGTGKTKLAEKVARDLHAADPSFLPEPLIFNAKTTSTARELFYTYDALRHFHDANIVKGKDTDSKAPETTKYIQLQALGKAIALTNPNELNGQFLKGQYEQTHSSVVLIDEVDKAPRDFPNDILAEIERFSFQLLEANNQQIAKGPDHQIVIILTSNSEKNLPEAFLRRTVFYHIDFPDREHLIGIINSHLSPPMDATTQMKEDREKKMEKMVDLFQKIRTTVRRKKPATAEFIAWVRILELQGFLNGELQLNQIQKDSDDWHTLQRSFSILAKTRTDLQALEEIKLEEI